MKYAAPKSGHYTVTAEISSGVTYSNVTASPGTAVSYHGVQPIVTYVSAQPRITNTMFEVLSDRFQRQLNTFTYNYVASQMRVGMTWSARANVNEAMKVSETQ